MVNARTLWTRPLSTNADTHLYIDMSGGVFAEDWAPIVFIEVARLKALSTELDTPLILRLTAFSHEVADDAAPITITATSPSPEEVAELIAAIPKATGGTDFRVVWNRINSWKPRYQRDNVIVTDFQWWASVDQFRDEHPDHLRYIPIKRAALRDKAHFASCLNQASFPSAERISA